MHIKKFYFVVVILIIWIVLIFNLSSQNAKQSNELSTGIAKSVVKIVEKIFPQEDFNIERINHLLRKTTHFFAYFVLGILTLDILWKIKGATAKKMIFALVFCIIFASTDEIHQLFVQGRGGQATDVIIDCLGSSVGICLRAFISRFIK